jgi:hypothetical protein
LPMPMRSLPQMSRNIMRLFSFSSHFISSLTHGYYFSSLFFHARIAYSFLYPLLQ